MEDHADYVVMHLVILVSLSGDRLVACETSGLACAAETQGRQHEGDQSQLVIVVSLTENHLVG